MSKVIERLKSALGKRDKNFFIYVFSLQKYDNTLINVMNDKQIIKVVTIDIICMI